jgi:hypothetical protein
MKPFVGLRLRSRYFGSAHVESKSLQARGTGFIALIGS